LILVAQQPIRLLIDEAAQAAFLVFMASTNTALAVLAILYQARC
jgi:hypothetical protein